MTTERDPTVDSVGDPIPLARRLLNELTLQHVPHCHWKSNQHLENALMGDDDLDLLIDQERLDDAYRILSELGFRRGRVAPVRVEPGLEDFLGNDRTTGRLVHVHAHYRLVTGERHLKRYLLPWEQHVLSTRVLSAQGVWIPEPAVEATLLVIRAALKIRHRDRVRVLFTSRNLSDWFADELRWLRSQTEDDNIRQQSEILLNDKVASLIADGLDQGFSRARMLSIRSEVRRALAIHTTHKGLTAHLRRWRREWSWAQRGLSRHYLNRPRLYGRGLPSGGLLVVLIGADGSGKSTLVRDLRSWFSVKLDTMEIYFGSGDGPSSALRWPLSFLRRILAALGQTPGNSTAAGSVEGKKPGVLKAIWALALAREKYKRIKKAASARQRGLLVVCDRYPQIQQPGINDGPLLHEWRGPGFRGFLARVEAKPYQLADAFPPDLVIRLMVDQEVAQQRRPDHDPVDLDRRRSVVAGLEFSNARFGCVDVDANRAYPEVLDEVKGEIWRRI